MRRISTHTWTASTTTWTGTLCRRTGSLNSNITCLSATVSINEPSAGCWLGKLYELMLTGASEQRSLPGLLLLQDTLSAELGPRRVTSARVNAKIDVVISSSVEAAVGRPFGVACSS
jgi:hypothetical protein